MKSKVLFVDDEPNILQAYQRNLRTEYTIYTAESGDEALRKMVSDGPFEVIVSDMKMPGMDGAEFLSKAKNIHPDSVRIMLTGNADQGTATRAVNEGKIFRFINKPCSPNDMAEAVNAAIQQYSLVTLEKKILEDTVNGCIKALIEVMSISKPEVFGRSSYYKSLASSCAHNLGLETLWEIEASSMLSLIGVMSLPDNIYKSFFSGEQVTASEARQFQNHPLIGAEIISKIPRLENVANAIKYQRKNYNGSGFPEDDIQFNNIPIAARIIRVVSIYESLERKDFTIEEILEKLNNTELYDPAIVESLQKVIEDKKQLVAKTVSLNELQDGMQIAKDILTDTGSVLICRGQQVTSSMIRHLRNFYKLDKIKKEVSILIKK